MAPLTHLLRPQIVDLEPYHPILPLDVLARRLGLPIEQLVKLDANENPYGPAAAAREALVAERYYHIYPDPQQTALREALSRYSGRPAAEILCGTGADELLDLLTRLLIGPGDAVIDCQPTFGMYRFDAAVCGGRVIDVPRNADFSLDLAGIEAAAPQAKLLFLTSPNNPTGNPTPRAEIERLLQLPLVVVVDEAYIEFAEPDHDPRGVSDLLDRYDNLVIVRTFSKWAGLAGLRIGYGMFPAWLAEQLWKMRQPYSVAVAAQAAALASLDHIAAIRPTIQALVAERERLLPRLAATGFLTPLPSQANFILCRVTRGDAQALRDALATRGILVRHYRTALLQGFIRISIGTPAQSERLLAALEELAP
jgi:histidinol-phosphate aminotransferase